MRYIIIFLFLSLFLGACENTRHSIGLTGKPLASDGKFEDTLKKSLHFLKNKAKTLGDIYENAQYIMKDQIQVSAEDLKLLDNLSKKILNDFLKEFENLSNLSKENLEKVIKGLIDKYKTNFKGVGQPLRITLTGSKFGPGIYDIILSLDKNETVKRLKAVN